MYVLLFYDVIEMHTKKVVGVTYSPNIFPTIMAHAMPFHAY